MLTKEAVNKQRKELPMSLHWMSLLKDFSLLRKLIVV